MKRIKRTPAEKARAQYTGYLVKEPMELMDFLAAKMPDASRTKLTYIIHSGFISGYQNRYGDNLKPPTNVYHRMTA